MPVQFENFDHSFKRDGKPIFKPSAIGKKIGYDIKAQVEDAFDFDPFVYHFRPGGHVTALHEHRNRSIFSRVDVERFFYGIGRNRVARALRTIGLARSEHYAKWSTVKNPYELPTYALPYGFVQSPILATLVLVTSPVGAYLRNLAADITVSIYMDDIALSGDDVATVGTAFEGLLTVLQESEFSINEAKTRVPSPAIDVFNCDLTFHQAAVREERRAAFYAQPSTEQSMLAFARYCESVEQGNG